MIHEGLKEGVNINESGVFIVFNCLTNLYLFHNFP